jgi:hypothetical protein
MAVLDGVISEAGKLVACSGQAQGVSGFNGIVRSFWPDLLQT